MRQPENIEAVRIVLIAYTASFRVPAFVGYQLTLTVPPLCTIFGLLSAAAGRWVMPSEVEWLAYRCTYESKANDLEAIYTVERSKPMRQVLLDTTGSFTPALPPSTPLGGKRPRERHSAPTTQ